MTAPDLPATVSALKETVAGSCHNEIFNNFTEIFQLNRIKSQQKVTIRRDLKHHTT